MRILLFISSMESGGAERVMAILCNKLAERNHEIYLATNTDRPFAYPLCSDVHIIPLYPSNYARRSRLFRFFALYSLIREIAKRVKPEVIISFMYTLNAKVLLATLGLGIPVVVSERTTFDIRQSWLARFRRLYVNRLAACVTVQTQYDYRYLGKRLPRKTVMPNPLDFPLRYDRTLKEKIVLTVGSVDRWEDKGFGILIEIWKGLVKEHPDWQLVIAGGGNEKNFECLKSVVERYGVTDSVRLLGFRKDVCELMYKSAVFVLASKYEGMPNCLLEAMSQGCACVSFDCVTGPAEMITEGYSGILVENQNVQKMAFALHKVMQDEELRNMLSEGALQDVTRYLPDNIIARWEVLLSECVEK